MGEAADDPLNGDVCEQCGEWLGDGHGYPQSCKACENASAANTDKPRKKAGRK